MDLSQVPAVLSQVPVTIIVSILTSGLSAALYNRWLVNRDAQARSQRIHAALVAEVRRARRLLEHNARTA